MTKAIEQTVQFNATPQELFEMYLDSKKHTDATGGRARMSRKVGGKFTAWNEMLHGRNLMIVPNRMIVQSWRSINFKKSDPDSILILFFGKTAKGGEVELTHVNVPPHDHQGVTTGWRKYYWEPWKKYLVAKKKKSR